MLSSVISKLPVDEVFSLFYIVQLLTYTNKGGENITGCCIANDKGSIKRKICLKVTLF